jgi:hypothetical protein
VAQGVVDAKNMGDATVPIIVRLQGTNAAIAKELIDNSGMPILSAVEQEAADQVKAALSIKKLDKKTCSPWRTGFCFKIIILPSFKASVSVFFPKIFMSICLYFKL